MRHQYRNIRTIFSQYKTFHVPYYQRRYVWNTVNKGRNLYKFIDDISNEYIQSEQSQYFIGSLAFCEHSVTDIVDGQQRLTSLVLLLTILAENKCSTKYKSQHKKMMYTNDQFIIQEPYYLTEELEGVLGYKSYSGTGFKVKLDDTVIKIKDQINRNLSNFSTSQFDGLYDYILNNVFIITLEYNNIKDALRYFLNINSLSVELSQAEIFYTILSQALSISHSPNDINSVISGIDKLLSDYKGIKKPEDVIYIFLSAFYGRDTNISDLDEIGVGKWIAYYHTEIFGDQIVADGFCKTFLQFLSDLEYLLSVFQHKTTQVSTDSPLYLSYALLNYEKYFDMMGLLVALFKNRHNYSGQNIFDATNTKLDIQKLIDISKRLNLTLINNYIRDSNKRLDGFISNIELDSTGKPRLSLAQILNNINLDSIFTLGYLNNFQSNPKINIPDKSRLIKIIFALQEAFLNHTAKRDVSMYRYFADLIDGQKFTIEHEYSVKEYSDPTRVAQWKGVGRFNNANEFDLERSKFENLSLLNSRANSSANDDIIYDKLNKYRTASAVLTTENEYLVQSLVPDSPFYLDSNIASLGLPNRQICRIMSNTWEHSQSNREFNKKLLYLSLQKLI